MIEPGYVRTMARYNAWQNRQLMDLLDDAPDDLLCADQGAFFGSIMATLNHILWGDTLWMNRFEPRISAPAHNDHVNFTPTFAVWSAERFRLDGAMRMWADTLRGLDLKQDLEWQSVLLDRTFSQSLSFCIMQLFNHETHHRGQVHAMMTAAGLEAPLTDLVFMPED